MPVLVSAPEAPSGWLQLRDRPEDKDLPYREKETCLSLYFFIHKLLPGNLLHIHTTLMCSYV